MNKGERLTSPNGPDNRVPHPTQVSHWQKREVNRGILPEVTSSPVDPYPSMREWGISVINGRLETAEDRAAMDEMELSPRELLTQLHFEQEKEDEKQQKESGIIGFPLRTDTELFFSCSLHTAAITASLRTPESFDQLKKLVIGAVYAANAEEFVKTNLLQPEQVILSGTKAHRIYKRLYPYAREIKQPFQLTSLEGISEADAFVTEKDTDGNVKIVRVIEYKAGTTNERLFNSYTTMNVYKTENPDLFTSESDFLYVVPELTQLPRVQANKNTKISMVQAPIDRRDLAKFIDYFITTYRESEVDNNKRSGNIRAEGSATIADAYNWGRVKAKEGSAQIKPGPKISVDEWLAHGGHK